MASYFQSSQEPGLANLATAQNPQSNASQVAQVQYEELKEEVEVKHEKIKKEESNLNPQPPIPQTSFISSSGSDSGMLIENVIRCKSIEEFRAIYPVIDISLYVKAMNMGGPLKPFLYETLKDHINNESSESARRTVNILKNELQTEGVKELLSIANINQGITWYDCCGFCVCFICIGTLFSDYIQTLEARVHCSAISQNFNTLYEYADGFKI